VYVRTRQDLPVVREICAKAFSPAADIAFLNVDLCRSDLLVEIEGIVFPGAPRTELRASHRVEVDTGVST
jgi:hypothetical protein